MWTPGGHDDNDDTGDMTDQHHTTNHDPPLNPNSQESEATVELNIIAPKMRTILYVCRHVSTQEVLSHVAMRLAAQPQRLCFVSKGRLVINDGSVGDWSDAEEQDWFAPLGHW